MTPLQKPEWLELADNDNSTSLRKVSRGLPVLALVATAAILGVGAIFAQPQELSVANADSNVVTTPQTVQPVATSDSAPVTADPVITTNPVVTQNQTTPAVISISKEAVATKATATTRGIKNPSIGVMPTGGGDDDEEGGDD